MQRYMMVLMSTVANRIISKDLIWKSKNFYVRREVYSLIYLRQYF